MAPVAQGSALFYDAASDSQCRLVVKHTFLDLVAADDAEDGQPGALCRSRTDSVLFQPREGLGPEVYRPGSPWTSSSEVTDAESEHAQEVEQQSAPSSDERVEVSSDAARRAVAAQNTKQVGAVQKRPADPVVNERRTTIMMRNLPNNYTRTMFLQMLDSKGFKGTYDFVYLPIDFSRGCGLGYAFVNLTDPGLESRFQAVFGGFTKWALRSSKVCQVTWSDRDQGMSSNVKRYRNSPVMHQSVPDEYKPCIFSNGVRVPFPVPTRKLRSPYTKD